jgi:hypothetical protein
MTFRSLIAGAALIAALPVWAQTATPEASKLAPPARTENATQAQISPERLQALRQSLLPRIAVWDAAENAMRLPTAAELAALNANVPAGGSQQIVTLRGGGLAARADVAEISLLVADIQSDGRTAVRHAAPAKAAADPAKVQSQTSKQGSAHGQ